MRELAKDVAKQMDLFDKKGQPLAGEDREKALAKTKQDLQEFQNLMFAGKKWEVSDWLNFDAMKRKMRETMEGAVTKAEIRDLFVAPGKLAELNQRITTGLGKIKLDVYVGDPSKLARKSMEEQFHAAEQSLTQQRTLSKEVKQAYDDQRDAFAQIDSRQRQIAGNMAVQKDDAVGVFQAIKVGANMLTGVFGTTGKADLDVATKKFREINETILQMRSHPMQINAKGMDDLLKKVQDLKKNMPWSLDLQHGLRRKRISRRLKEMLDYTAYAAFDFANTRIIQSIRQVEEDFRKAENERLETARAAAQQRIEDEDRANQAIVQRANQALAEQRKAYFQMVDDTKSDNKRLTDDSHATMNKIVEEAEKEVHVLRNLAQEAERAVTDSVKRSKEICRHFGRHPVPLQ